MVRIYLKVQHAEHPPQQNDCRAPLTNYVERFWQSLQKLLFGGGALLDPQVHSQRKSELERLFVLRAHIRNECHEVGVTNYPPPRSVFNGLTFRSAVSEYFLTDATHVAYLSHDTGAFRPSVFPDPTRQRDRACVYLRLPCTVSDKRTRGRRIHITRWRCDLIAVRHARHQDGPRSRLPRIRSDTLFSRDGAGERNAIVLFSDAS